MSFETVDVPTKGTMKRHINVRCDGCQDELVPGSKHDLDEDGRWRYLEPQDGLRVELSGGYGMYYDGDPCRFLLCLACANRLLEMLPTMKAEVEKVW